MNFVERSANTMRKSDGGFTLVELMVAMVISASFLLGASIVVGDLVRETGRSEARQRAKNDALTALRRFDQDVFSAGTGFPMDVLVNPGDSAAVDDIEAILRHTIRDSDPGAAGADTIVFGGTGLQAGWAGSVVGIVSAIDASDNIETSRQDGPDIAEAYTACRSYVDPIVPDGTCGGALPTFLNLYGGNGWVYPEPKPVASIAALALDSLTVDFDELNPIGTRAPAPGQNIIYYRGVYDALGAVVNPQNLPLTRWTLVQPGGAGTVGTLRREFGFVASEKAGVAYPDPVFINSIDVLNNVVDFQVDFLVFRCGGAPDGPRWVPNLIDNVTPTATGEFDHNSPATYDDSNDITGATERFMALRERLMAVRVTLLLRTPSEASAIDSSFVGGTVSDLQLENHINAGATLDPNFEYLTVQRVFDPVNLRLKGSETFLETFVPVRSTATDIQTFGAGFCRGRTS